MTTQPPSGRTWPSRAFSYAIVAVNSLWITATEFRLFLQRDYTVNPLLPLAFTALALAVTILCARRASAAWGEWRTVRGSAPEPPASLRDGGERH